MSYRDSPIYQVSGNSTQQSTNYLGQDGNFIIHADGQIKVGLSSSKLLISSPNFSNANGISFGTSNGAITASYVPAAATLSTFFPYFGGSTSSQTVGAIGVSTASAVVFPFFAPAAFAFNQLQIIESLSFVTSNASGAQTITSAFGLFSNNAGTLSLISSGSFSLAITVSSVSATLSYPTSTGTAGYGYDTTTASTTAQGHSLFGTVGNRRVGLVFSNSMELPAGMYWLGIHQRQSTTNAAVGLSSGFVCNAMNGSSAIAAIGSGSTAYTSRSDYHLGAHGFYTSTGSAGYGGTTLPSSMLLNGFNNNINNMALFTFMSI